MDTGDKATPVTRQEFNSALVLVWVFITLAFSTTVFTSRSPGPTNAIYLVIALFMVANYTIASWRGDVSRGRVVFAALLAAAALAVGAVAFFAGRLSP